MRLIDADALPKYTGYALSADEVARAVENAPTIEAEPVRRGRWERCGIKTYDFAFYCSECCSFSPNGIKTKYCPWCGAEMVD